MKFRNLHLRAKSRVGDANPAPEAGIIWRQVAFTGRKQPPRTQGKPVKSLLCSPQTRFFASLAYPDLSPAGTRYLRHSLCIQVPKSLMFSRSHHTCKIPMHPNYPFLPQSPSTPQYQSIKALQADLLGGLLDSSIRPTLLHSRINEDSFCPQKT